MVAKKSQTRNEVSKRPNACIAAKRRKLVKEVSKMLTRPERIVAKKSEEHQSAQRGCQIPERGYHREVAWAAHGVGLFNNISHGLVFTSSMYV